MPVFAYQGLDQGGRRVAGTRDAESARALRLAMRREGVFLTTVAEDTHAAVRGKGLRKEVDFSRLFERVSGQDVAMLTRQMATLVRAAIPIAEALASLVEQTENRKLRGALATVRDKVNQGSSLGDALAAYPAIFPDVYVNMVRAGEASGTLDEVFMRLADFLDSQARLRGKVLSAMLYPLVVMAVGAVIVGVLMVMVVPKISQIFVDLGQSLPWFTQLLILASKVTAGYWWAILLAIAAAVSGFRRWRKTPAGREAWDRFVLRLRLVGPLVRMISIGRFARTMATMLKSGVPLLKALDIVKAILGNIVLMKVIEEARDAIREGESVAMPLKRSGHFPPTVVHMIAVGERSGQLEQMLEYVATSYETEVELRLQRLTTLLEPLMIVAMAAVVAFIIFSILWPILQMNQMIAA